MKQWLITLGLVAVITAAIVTFVVRDAAATSRRQTAEAQTVGFVATPVTWSNGDEDEDGHTLTFAWVDAAGAVHPQTLEQITWYDPRKTYKVCYNPQDSADWKLYASDHACGG